MRSEDLYKAIGAIGDDLLERSEEEAAGEEEPGIVQPESGKNEGIQLASEKTEGELPDIEKSEGEKPGTWKVKYNPSETGKNKRTTRFYVTWVATAAACLLVVFGGVRAIQNMRMGSAKSEQAIAEAEDKKEATAEVPAEAEEDAPAEEAKAVDGTAPAMEEAAPEEAAPETEEEAATAESAAAAGSIEEPEEPEEEVPQSAEKEETSRDSGDEAWADEKFIKSDSSAAVLVSAQTENGNEAYDVNSAFSEEEIEAVRIFQEKSSAAILGNEEDTGNKVFSPIDLYTAMGMLTEVTNGAAKEELVELLGGGDQDAVREAAVKLVSMAQKEGETGTVRLANSLWLRRNTPYKLTPLLRLGEAYHASVFSGLMGSEEYNALLRNWISTNTDGLLDGMTDQTGFEGMTIMGLVSTLYYKAPWYDTFMTANTKNADFHTPSGDVQTKMMYTFTECPYYSGETFDAVALPLRDGSYAYFCLPKEGMTAESLVSGNTWLSVMNEPKAWRDDVIVELSLPRFDIDQTLDLREAFGEMGVRAIFTDWSSFSDVLDGEYAITNAVQMTRVITDEEGVTGASLVIEEAAAEADEDPKERVKIVFDRPFAFAISDGSGVMWFAGVVNEP